MKSKLILGDCLIHMKNIEDKSVDAIIADLPYGITSCKWDKKINTKELFKEYKRIIKDDGAILLFCKQPFTSELVLEGMNLFKYSIIWDKVKPTGFMMANFRPMNIHEEILVFSKSPATFTKKGKSMVYNPQGVLETKRIIKATKRSNASNNGGDTTKTYVGTKTNFPNSIVRFYNDDKNRCHDSQKPLSLMEYLIKTYTNEGETVLDNCMGSGSTGVACVNTNRKFIGIELDKNYFKIAIKRINEAFKISRNNL